MTIYATPFDEDTLQATAPSADSGFETIGDVIEAMGDGWKTCSGRAVIYDGLMFSDYPVAL